MNILLQFIHAPLAKTLGWSLVHFLWEGALIALVLAALLFLCGPRPARLRYGLCCLALLAMPIAFGVTLAWLRPVESAAPVGLMIPTAPGPEAGSLMVDAGSLPWTARLRDALPWAVPFWILGVAMCYLRSAAGWIAAQRLRRRGVCAAAEEWQERLARLRERIRISKPVALLESCLVDVPVVIGILRPAILMPVGMLVGLSTDQVEAILLHELAHIRRRDYLVNVLQNFVEGLLFYHPAVWWISKLVRAERENCCDDMVVNLNGDAYGYAVALATLENSRWPAREPALAASGGNLMKRIQRLVREPERSRTLAAPGLAAGLLVLLLSVTMNGWQAGPAAISPQAAITAPAFPSLQLVAQVHPTPPPAQRKQGSSAALESAYRKWLNEDVAYIITDAERAAYKALATDQEREAFVEQFWLRRDPTPGTGTNEFKEESYRRIAYANEHYAANTLPGWKTDRGRIYITYGPADEIESHPNGGAYRRPAEQGGGTTTTVPFEQWLYRLIEGVGTNVIVEFVDADRTGEYRMTIDPSEKNVRLNLPPEPHTPKESPRAGATIQVMGSTAALVSVPLSAYGNHAVDLNCRVVAADGSEVMNFHRNIQGPAPLFSRFIGVKPGSYRLVVSVRDLSTGAVTADDIVFEVK